MAASITLRLTGISGILLFGMLFIITFGTPDSIEKAGQAFIKYQVEKEVKENLGSSKLTNITKNAKLLSQKFGLDIDNAKQALENNLPQKIAAVIADMCRMDCQKKKILEKAITSGYEDQITSLSKAQDKLSGIIKGKYVEIVQNLTRDVRIFLGSNTLLFILLSTISFLKPQALKHLLLPSVLLFAATIISSIIYLFGQNWFFTIIYNDYMGFGYLAYVAIIFGFFMDIVFNGARITTELINALLSSIGSVASIAPC